MVFDSSFTTDVKSHLTRQLNTYLVQLLIRSNVFFFLAFKCFLLLNPLNVKIKRSSCEFKYFLCYLLVRRFPKSRIKREQKKNTF